MVLSRGDCVGGNLKSSAPMSGEDKMEEVKGTNLRDNIVGGTYKVAMLEYNVGNGSDASEVDANSNWSGENREIIPWVSTTKIREVNEEGSCRNGDSEDKGSGYSYSSDDELPRDFSKLMSSRYPEARKERHENPLVMNTSVAFGSDDWESFVQEVGESEIDMSRLNEKRKIETQTRDEFVTFSALENQIGLFNSHQTEQVQHGEKAVGGMDYVSHATPGEEEHIEDGKGVLLPGVQGPTDEMLVKSGSSSSRTHIDSVILHELHKKDETDIVVNKNHSRVIDESEDYLNSCSIVNIFEVDPGTQANASNKESAVEAADTGSECQHSGTKTEDLFNTSSCQVIERDHSVAFELQQDQCLEQNVNQCSHDPEQPSGGGGINAGELSDKDDMLNSLPSILVSNNDVESQNLPASGDCAEDQDLPIKTETLETEEFHDDVVHEMEEILLDSEGSTWTVYPRGMRDGGPSASTSGTDEGYSFIQNPLRIDSIEVIGAKQKRGDVSLSERLVGVKEYTVYIIKVRSGKDEWEVDRRYRDFFTLYQQLKAIFYEQGWILPSSWSSVENESTKMFGSASPDVVAERSSIIEECLRSILLSKYFINPPDVFLSFLHPQNSIPNSPASSSVPHHSFPKGTEFGKSSTLGKTIPLILEVCPHKSVKQLLDSQHYTCAGCYKRFDDGRTVMRDFIQKFGWGKPRLCEYTGQLFCSSCHTYETAVLPARVLHHWDFTEYAVSQLAKSYLDSIYDQPVLCVSAINPFLSSKVPALLQVMNLRKKIRTMLPYVHCPFQMSINKGMGSRIYLIESTDFFSLRDLSDLSKGAFAALPVMVENVARNILEHITEQCLVCCDSGVPCGARQACCEPSSLIFPFQDDRIERCTCCGQVFHKQCFERLMICPCRVQQGIHDILESPLTPSAGSETSRSSDMPPRRSDSTSSSGLVSGLFSKTKSDKAKDHKNGDTVIYMGSLPIPSL